MQRTLSGKDVILLERFVEALPHGDTSKIEELETVTYRGKKWRWREEEFGS